MLFSLNSIHTFTLVQNVRIFATSVYIGPSAPVSAGALYPDGTSAGEKRDDAVPPGVTLTYEWTLPDDHSPTSEESNCLTRFYHSHVSAPKDINSGLIGPLLICKKGSQKFTRKHDQMTAQTQTMEA